MGCRRRRPARACKQERSGEPAAPAANGGPLATALGAGRALEWVGVRLCGRWNTHSVVALAEESPDWLGPGASHLPSAVCMRGSRGVSAGRRRPARFECVEVATDLQVLWASWAGRADRLQLRDAMLLMSGCWRDCEVCVLRLDARNYCIPVAIDWLLDDLVAGPSQKRFWLAGQQASSGQESKGDRTEADLNSSCYMRSCSRLSGR